MNTTKKTIATVAGILLSLCAGMGLTGCSSPEDKLVGIWTSIEEISSSGEVSIYVDSTITFQEDGSCAVGNAGRSVVDCTWMAGDQSNVTMVIQGETMTGTLSQDELTMAEDGTTVVFTKA